VDHLLGINNGSGSGVERCTKISDEQKNAVEKDYNRSKVEKGKRDMKRQWIEREIVVSSSKPFILHQTWVAQVLPRQKQVELKH
jgi:hypothetical protein